MNNVKTLNSTVCLKTHPELSVNALGLGLFYLKKPFGHI